MTTRRTSWARYVTVAALTLSGVACAVTSCSSFTASNDPSTDAAAPDTATAPVVSADDAGVAPDARSCPSLAGEAVRIGAFCIDATEVTNRQYERFYASYDGGQPPECAWNTSFKPDFWPRSGSAPVRGVDWCDAWAYCRWAGKRLCGKIGGGAVPSDQRDNAFGDEWYRACSADGTKRFPYGNTYDPSACNLPDYDAGGAVDVGSLPRCVGGYPGIFDMTGNLWEWEDSCGDAGAAATCSQRGGSYAAATTGPCAQVREIVRSDTSDVTIRCCSD